MENSVFQQLSAEIESLPLSLDHWDKFLEVIRHFYHNGSASAHFLKIRFKLDQKCLDRITTSLLRLNWVSFSLGVWKLSDLGITQLKDIKNVQN